jgi:hypothetical protein
MADSDSLPPDLKALDRRLGGIRFRPRGSLGAEVVGRLRRGGQWKGDAPPRRSRLPLAALAACAAVALIAWIGWSRSVVVVDRCCYDLDGGIAADDGLLVLADRKERVRRIAVYEDLDGSRSFTDGDLIRFSRGSAPTLLGPDDDQLVTTRHCCIDFDGGGPADDGLLVVGVPPNRVMMVALYDRSRDLTPSGYILR